MLAMVSAWLTGQAFSLRNTSIGIFSNVLSQLTITTGIAGSDPRLALTQLLGSLRDIILHRFRQNQHILDNPPPPVEINDDTIDRINDQLQDNRDVDTTFDPILDNAIESANSGIVGQPSGPSEIDLTIIEVASSRASSRGPSPNVSPSNTQQEDFGSTPGSQEEIVYTPLILTVTESNSSNTITVTSFSEGETDYESDSEEDESHLSSSKQFYKRPPGEGGGGGGGGGTPGGGGGGGGGSSIGGRRRKSYRRRPKTSTKKKQYRRRVRNTRRRQKRNTKKKQYRRIRRR
jgi:uncharacterized membrane protein YgcG